MSTKRKTWTTEDEIEFIKNIKHGEKFLKLELLQNYKQSIRRRKNLGNLKMETIMIFLNQEILREEKGMNG